MGWRRHSGAVVSLALLASVVGHFALQRQFEARFQSLVADSRLDGHLKPGPPLMPLDDEGPSAIPRFLDQIDRPQRFQHILPALQIRQDGANDGTPFVVLRKIESGQSVEVESLRITAVAVNHVVPTLGFIIEDRSAAVVIPSDTRPAISRSR